MGVAPATFNSAGQTSQHYIPGAYSRRDFVANSGGSVSSGNVCILGYSELGQPLTLLVFGSSGDARSALQSGDGLEGVLQAFTPGGGYTPQEIGFMRVNPGTQSSRVLQASSADVFTLTSFSYGTPMNQLKLQFLAGTETDTYKVLANYKGEVSTTDNIAQNAFTVQYTGSGTAATMTISATTLATTVTGSTGEDLSLTLSEYTTMSDLVAYIDGLSGYSATLVVADTAYTPSTLDYVTAADIRTSAYSVKNDFQAIYLALVNEPYVGSVTKESAGGRVIPDVDSDYVYFTGGTAGAYTSTQFIAALTALEDEDIQFIATPSTDAAIHTLIRNHCDDMNSVTGRKERQALLGGALNETVSQVLTRARNLNRGAVKLCSPGYTAYNDAGESQEYAPSYYGCKQAGQYSALAINTPSTHKGTDVLSWEKNYTDSELRQLIKGGVTAGGKDLDGIYITVRSITTYQSASLQQNEFSVIRETYYQDRDLRLRQERALVGQPGTGESALAVVDAIFERAISDWNGLGLITTSPNGNLYEGYTRSLSGDTVTVEYTTYNVVGINFVFTTHSVAIPVVS